MSRITDRHIEAAAYALYRFDAAKHPIRQTTEVDKWYVWKRVRPSYVKRAELALQAVIADAQPPPEPPRAAKAGEALALDLDPGPEPSRPLV